MTLIKAEAMDLLATGWPEHEPLMRKLELQLEDDLWIWLETTAKSEEVSVEELVIILIGLESGLRNRTSDGRNYSYKTEMYRGSTRLIAPRYTPQEHQEMKS